MRDSGAIPRRLRRAQTYASTWGPIPPWRIRSVKPLQRSDPTGFRQARGILFGTPEESVGIIGEYVNAGAQGLNIDFRAPFDWEALQAFIEEVMPVFA